MTDDPFDAQTHLDAIRSGAHDEYFRRLFEDAKVWGHPLWLNLRWDWTDVATTMRQKADAMQKLLDDLEKPEPR